MGLGTVAEARQRMSAAEFTMWAAFYGLRQDDLNLAMEAGARPVVIIDEYGG